MTRLFQYIINIFITDKKQTQNEKLLSNIKEHEKE